MHASTSRHQDNCHVKRQITTETLTNTSTPPWTNCLNSATCTTRKKSWTFFCAKKMTFWTGNASFTGYRWLKSDINHMQNTAQGNQFLDRVCGQTATQMWAKTVKDLVRVDRDRFCRDVSSQACLTFRSILGTRCLALRISGQERPPEVTWVNHYKSVRSSPVCDMDIFGTRLERFWVITVWTFPHLSFVHLLCFSVW